MEAQVHAVPPSGTEATDNQLNSDSDEEFVPKQKKKTPPKSVTQKRPLRKSKSPVMNAEGRNYILKMRITDIFN